MGASLTIHTMFAWIVMAFSLLPHCVHGQIRVMAPESPKTRVGEKGAIEGSTATFGAPFFSDDVVGKLVYGEPKSNFHCTEDDYEIPDPETEKRGDSETSVKMINIVSVRRGKYSFTTKVKTAYCLWSAVGGPFSQQITHFKHVSQSSYSEAATPADGLYNLNVRVRQAP